MLNFIAGFVVGSGQNFDDFITHTAASKPNANTAAKHSLNITL